MVKVVVTEVEILQSGQEVIEGVRGYGVELVIGQDQVTKVGQAFEMVILVDVKKKKKNNSVKNMLSRKSNTQYTSDAYICVFLPTCVRTMSASPTFSCAF